MHAAVGVNMHQCAGLIVPGGGERYAEFHRRQRQPALQHRAGLVKRADCGAAALIATAQRQPVDDQRDNIVFHGLVIGRHVAAAVAVEIASPHLERIEAEREGNLLDDALGPQHALRSAKAAKRGVGHGVGLQRQRAKPHGWIKIAIVGVKQRTVGDWPRKIGGKSATRGVGHVDSMNNAMRVKSGFVIDDEVVPLAGDQHVIVTVGPQFRSAAQTPGGQRRNRRELVGLGFLSAKAAAHAPHLDRHRVRRHAQHKRHHMLHFARMLRRRIDRDLVLLAGDGEGDLRFEIKMILAADFHAAFEAQRRAREAGGGVAARQRQRIGDQRAAGPRCGNVENERQLVIADLRQRGGAAGGVSGQRRYRENRLAGIMHHALRQHRLVVAMRRADVVDARNISCREYCNDTRRGAHWRKIDRGEAGMRLLRQAEREMHEAVRLGHVVNICRLTAHVPRGAVMRMRLAGAADDWLRRCGGGVSGRLTHVPAPRRR